MILLVIIIIIIITNNSTDQGNISTITRTNKAYTYAQDKNSTIKILFMRQVAATRQLQTPHHVYAGSYTTSDSA
jgi:hypothetical protein